MSTFTEITLTKSTECPHCGTTRTHISQDGIAALSAAGFNVSTGRDFEDTGDGGTFGHGGNYDVIDEDLLGGDGTGALVSRLLNEHGIYFRRAGFPAAATCGECAKYL